MSVGELIKEYLAEAGISQKWLSNRTGIATAKLNLALHGKRRMTFEEYALICGTLGVNTDRFIQPKVRSTEATGQGRGIGDADKEKLLQRIEK